MPSRTATAMGSSLRLLRRSQLSDEGDEDVERNLSGDRALEGPENGWPHGSPHAANEMPAVLDTAVRATCFLAAADPIQMDSSRVALGVTLGRVRCAL